MKKRLLISFSGGRTSGYMLWWLLNCWKDRNNWEIVIVFANTSKEDEGTLKFIKDCSDYWSIEIIWVEAVPVQSPVRVTKSGKVIGGKWWGVKHRIVTFDTAHRKGEVFEAIISKLGIPTTNAPFCSDQLKRKAIQSYLKSIGWGKYYKAIGIRADEIDRMNEKYRAKRILYPLVNLNPTDKPKVISWWLQQEFNLMIDEDLGNCDGCWKKDMNRLVRIANKKPMVFDWWQDMTDKYGHIQSRPGNTKMKPPFNFYRGNISPKEIFELAKLDQSQLRLFSEKEKLNGCSETCEAF